MAAVQAWLATVPAQRFDLADGSLRLVHARRASMAWTRDSLAQSLGTFLFAQGHDDPLAFVKAIVEKMCNNGRENVDS
jgi:hypothetical protein